MSTRPVRPRLEHDACGVGFVVDIKGRKSHAIVRQALQVLINLEHRGACGCEVNTGDGAGILVQMPDTFLRKVAPAPLPPAGEYGVGLVFLPHDAPSGRAAIKALVAGIVAEEGQTLLGWRDVPTDDSLVGPSAVAVEPAFEQVFIARGVDARPALMPRSAFERKLYVIRKRIEHAVDALSIGADAEEAVLHLQPVVQHADLQGHAERRARSSRCSPICAIRTSSRRSRSCTSGSAPTRFPSWPLAHPYRFIAHNGEINTLTGNINWMRAREGLLQSSVFGDDLKKILPVIREGGSDTATFDNVLEFLVMTGRSLPHAILMMIPEPWQNHETMDAGAQGVLRIPLVADGAVGRPGVDRVLRRHGDRRGPGPQRPASVALLRHEGRPGRDGVRSGRARHSARGHRAEGAAAPGPHLPRRHGTRPDRLRRRGEARARGGAAVQGVAEAPHRHRRSRSGAVSAAAEPRDRAAAAAAVRLHARGSAHPAGADGDQRRGSDRLDGHRHGARGAVGPAAAAVRLLQAGVRAGDQPAARRDSRGAGDVDGIDDRARRATCSIRGRSRAGRSRSSTR